MEQLTADWLTVADFLALFIAGYVVTSVSTLYPDSDESVLRIAIKRRDSVEEVR